MTAEASRTAPTPWMRLVRLALVGTVVMTFGVFLDNEANGGHPVGLIQPGAGTGPRLGSAKQWGWRQPPGPVGGNNYNNYK